MKRIVIGMLVCALCVGLAAVATVADFEKKESRIHQHLEAGEKAACSHGDNLLCTHLPLVEIETGGHDIPGAPILDDKGFIVDYTVTEAGESRLKATVEITDNAETNNHVTDTPALATSALINIRGRSSREFDKKSYRITLIYDDGINNNQSVMGMDAHHEWVLHGPFLDKSLIRNYMWYNIAGECMEYAPNVRFCEVVIDGSYQGLYLMMESITKGYDDSRLSMEVKKKGNSFSGYDDDLIRGGKRSRVKKPSAQQMMAPIKIETAYMAGDTIVVRDLCEKIGKTSGEIIKKLFLLGIMATINQELDYDTASLVASEFGVTLEMKLDKTAEDALSAENVEDSEEDLITRPPVVTIMGPTVASVLTGTFVIESIFNIPGLGKYFVTSIKDLDYTMIGGTVVFYGALLIICTLVVDLLYGFIDPRVKLEE